MSRHVNAISGRLSLRAPQRESLERLHRVMSIARPTKDTDPAQVLNAIRAEFPQVLDFERKFPSLCFSLATGVGKTRLMGAFIAYLHLEHGIRNFLVLAPGLTVYSKLIADFAPASPKYVFQGITELAVQRPLIITGENWESGIGIRDQVGSQGRLLNERLDINVFNIAKLVGSGADEAKRKMRSMREVLGESYFGYLASLPDLVVLMDEAHRYRAKGAMQAIEELKPVLGLELTATPQTEGAGGGRFRNVIYDYPLASAMKDGLVKEPAVATRKDLNPDSMGEAQLEQLKLEDGVRVHEATKVDLEVYARENNVKLVKPFVLVVASDTTHAGELVQRISAPEFFEGRYKGRVIEVHSGKSGAEKDEIVDQLLNVERPDNPTEIVVHVNMLKEGWDVTNLYTIVPLRAANSKTLVEQSIGRGLRLPYGKRTGVPAVDRLTLIAHDKFQEIVDEAKKGGFSFSELRIGEDIAVTPQKTVVVPPLLDGVIDGTASPAPSPGATTTPAPKPTFTTPMQQAVARATIEVIQTKGTEICRHYGLTPGPAALSSPEVSQRIAQEAVLIVQSGQVSLPGMEPLPDVPLVVAEATALYLALTISIPRIVVLPKGLVRAGFRPFELSLGALRLQPVSHQILVQHLASTHSDVIGGLRGGEEEPRLEDYVVRGLIDFDDVSYDDMSELLYKLAGQVVNHLRGYLSNDEEVRNVLVFHQRRIVDLVHSQMKDHAWEEATSYEVEVTTGFAEIRAQAYAAPIDQPVRDYRQPVENKIDIRKMLFGGFKKGVYPVVKFDSDTERRLTMILEDDATVRKWTKPGKGVFQIHYTSEARYEPDFVVETETEKLLCEPKAADAVEEAVIQAKARAAAIWCAQATAYETANGGKPWRYLLIPHDHIANNMSVAALIKAFTVKAPAV